MEQKKQNATLMTTCIDDDGSTKVMYIPLNIDVSVVDFFLKNGTCTNNQAVTFNIDMDEDTFWNKMWKELLDEEE